MASTSNPPGLVEHKHLAVRARGQVDQGGPRGPQGRPRPGAGAAVGSGEERRQARAPAHQDEQRAVEGVHGIVEGGRPVEQRARLERVVGGFRSRREREAPEARAGPRSPRLVELDRVHAPGDLDEQSRRAAGLRQGSRWRGGGIRERSVRERGDASVR